MLSVCLTVFLAVPLSLAVSPVFSRSLSHPCAPLSGASHPAGRLAPPAQPSRLQQRQEGRPPRGPTPDSGRRTQASPRGPLGSGSPCRARLSTRGHSRARGAAKVRDGGGEERLRRRELLAGTAPSPARLPPQGCFLGLPREESGAAGEGEPCVSPLPISFLQVRGIAV